MFFCNYISVAIVMLFLCTVAFFSFHCVPASFIFISCNVCVTHISKHYYLLAYLLSLFGICSHLLVLKSVLDMPWIRMHAWSQRHRHSQCSALIVQWTRDVPISGALQSFNPGGNDMHWWPCFRRPLSKTTHKRCTRRTHPVVILYTARWSKK